MSYPHLSAETVNECSRAAYAYDPDCYCVFHWAHADFPPRLHYHPLPTKWLKVGVWRCTGPGQPDRFVLAMSGDNERELLRNLSAALLTLTDGTREDASLLLTSQHEQALRKALRHPLLTMYRLLEVLDTLVPRLPRFEASTLTSHLQEAIDQRSREVYTPPKGGGWIASAPQTTQELAGHP